jgi:hypothetical protein
MLSKICVEVLILMGIDFISTLLSERSIAKSPSSFVGNLFTTYSSMPANFTISSHIGVVTIFIILLYYYSI